MMLLAITLRFFCIVQLKQTIYIFISHILTLVSFTMKCKWIIIEEVSIGFTKQLKYQFVICLIYDIMEFGLLKERCKSYASSTDYCLDIETPLEHYHLVQQASSDWKIKIRVWRFYCNFIKFFVSRRRMNHLTNGPSKQCILSGKWRA